MDVFAAVWITYMVFTGIRGRAIYCRRGGGDWWDFVIAQLDAHLKTLLLGRNVEWVRDEDYQSHISVYDLFGNLEYEIRFQNGIHIRAYWRA